MIDKGFRIAVNILAIFGGISLAVGIVLLALTSSAYNQTEIDDYEI